MTPDPVIPLTEGSLSLGTLSDPLLVDPDPPLLATVREAYRAAFPDLVDPDLDALRVAADGKGIDQSRSGGVSGGPRTTLTVLAAEAAVDAVTHGFHAASRFAALTESGAVELLTLSAPQPNAVLAARETGCVLVEGENMPTNGTASERIGGTERSASDRTWHRVGNDPTLRDRYAESIATAQTRHLRTPSRHRMYRAFDDRCGEAVATDVIRVLDTDPTLSRDDLVGPRIRAYAVGARHELLDYDLRRACEDAGIGSPSTFTRVKRRLIDAGVIGTERVPQPVGRPRERIAAKPDLADPPLSAVGETIRVALENETE